MNWDYFISHASEDKLAIAQPLASYLSLAGFRVWYDEFSLKVGDSLLQSIDAGLAGSAFGVTILSRSFFAKKWPKSELSGLFSLEGEAKKILPVWHDVDAATVASYSPVIADRVAVSSAKGLQAVAAAIVGSSFPERSNCLPLKNYAEIYFDGGYDSSKDEFRSLLNEGASDADLRAFLSVNHKLVVGDIGRRDAVIPGYLLPLSLGIDFAVVTSAGVTGPMSVELIFLASRDRRETLSAMDKISQHFRSRVLPRQRPRNYHGGAVLCEFPSVEPIGESIRGMVNTENIHLQHPGSWLVSLRIYGGRRVIEGSPSLPLPAELQGIQVDVASYDRIADQSSVRRRF
ncbi:toll/interleukin-1 receptor domain-containing protein [Rhizobium sp. Rhizsp82]|uniref:toll/interleukin-1 receptor domain-containing protein n=1 Tax=Rhizobium sp. Rhizsp82 TaxID=3243057 RepID=UPI0039B6C99A